MKLWNDFGVRALLATICTVGFYAVVFYILHRLTTIETETALAVIGIAQAPVTVAVGFYFGTKVAK